MLALASMRVPTHYDQSQTLSHQHWWHIGCRNGSGSASTMADADDGPPPLADDDAMENMDTDEDAWDEYSGELEELAEFEALVEQMGEDGGEWEVMLDEMDEDFDEDMPPGLVDSEVDSDFIDDDFDDESVSVGSHAADSSHSWWL